MTPPPRRRGADQAGGVAVGGLSTDVALALGLGSPGGPGLPVGDGSPVGLGLGVGSAEAVGG
ncbi:hypothetical protein, partial [Micromonospora maritima]|uniref:hypothetical protein n=1 Tax=Micromonospora maritima TaxID=986711 RepID=UPI001C2D41E1